MSENYQLVYQTRRKCEIYRDTGVSKKICFVYGTQLLKEINRLYDENIIGAPKMRNNNWCTIAIYTIAPHTVNALPTL